MLARLDEELAPLRASVNREGSLLRVDGLEDDGDASRVVEVVESVGYLAQQTEDAPDVVRWFGTAEVDELSREEAQVLADRWSKELVEESVVHEETGVADVLRSVLVDAFREAARTGEIGRIEIDMDALRSVLGEEVARAVRAWIRTRLGHPTG